MKTTKTPKQNCTVIIQVTLHQPGKITERIKIQLAPTDRDTAEKRYRKLTPVVFKAGTQFKKEHFANHVAANIGDVLAKHGKKVAAIIHKPHATH